MSPVCVPSRAAILTAAGAGVAGSAAAAAVLEPWLLLGPCMGLMVIYPAVCAVAEHLRRVRGGDAAPDCGTAEASRGRTRTR